MGLWNFLFFIFFAQWKCWSPLCVFFVVRVNRVWDRNVCVCCRKNVVTSDGLAFLFEKSKGGGRKKHVGTIKQTQVYTSSPPFCSPHQSVCMPTFIHPTFLTEIIVSTSVSLAFSLTPSPSFSFGLPHLSCSIFIPSPTEPTSGSYWQSEQPLSHKRLSGLCVCTYVLVCAWQSMAYLNTICLLIKRRFHQITQAFTHSVPSAATATHGYVEKERA